MRHSSFRNVEAFPSFLTMGNCGASLKSNCKRGLACMKTGPSIGFKTRNSPTKELDDLVVHQFRRRFSHLLRSDHVELKCLKQEVEQWDARPPRRSSISDFHHRSPCSTTTTSFPASPKLCSHTQRVSKAEVS